jgi:tRNA pseudouridine55 synthase
VPPRALTPAGLVLVDKPAGPSSFALVRELRNRTGARAGHAGTLDPFATGLLLVLLGSATRLAQYLVGLDKRYVTEVDLTARTATGDPEGEVIEEHDPPSREELEARLATLRGEVELPIPAASAVKIAGERAYKLARRGVTVDMPLRRSKVHALDLLDLDGSRATLGLHVGSGTYVRSIASALGGHCRSLRRTAVGPFSVADAELDRIIPPFGALPFLPERELGNDEVDAIRAGRGVSGPGDGLLRLVANGALVAVGRAGGGMVKPETVIP